MKGVQQQQKRDASVIAAEPGGLFFRGSRFVILGLVHVVILIRAVIPKNVTLQQISRAAVTTHVRACAVHHGGPGGGARAGAAGNGW